MALARSVETVLVTRSESRYLLKPALSPSRRQDFNDAGRSQRRIPHGMCDVSWLQRPLACRYGSYFIINHYADLTRQHIDPDVVSMGMGDDKCFGLQGLFYD